VLNGIKVLSFTHFLQGPAAVQMLADLGADVIKIESPKGAYERYWSGFDAYLNDVSVFFLLGNRNQRSLSVDLRREEGKEIVKRLIKEADILVENFRPGVMERLGLGYEEIEKINPGLIYCSCTGYGSDGPYRDRPGQDLLLQGMSGLAMLSGQKESPPVPVGTAVVDQHAAVLASFGIMAALFDRVKTGKGCKVDSNLLNAALDLQIEPLTYHLNKGPLWDRSNTGLSSRFHQSPYGIYETSDGYITISVSPVEKLVQAFENDELKKYTVQDQMDKREEVDKIISDEVRKKTTDEWMDIFHKLDIWHAPVNGYEAVEKDPQVEWNKMIKTINHPDAGQVRLLGHPIQYNGQEPSITRYPPRLGEHTKEILEQHGYSGAEIIKLLDDNVVLDHNVVKNK
jgi:crotonobetainyl-CoA:carnitine CoA-transferase CaiB-like acyl-CoA transferase